MATFRRDLLLSSPVDIAKCMFNAEVRIQQEARVQAASDSKVQNTLGSCPGCPLAAASRARLQISVFSTYKTCKHKLCTLGLSEVQQPTPEFDDKASAKPGPYYSQSWQRELRPATYAIGLQAHEEITTLA